MHKATWEAAFGDVNLSNDAVVLYLDRTDHVGWFKRDVEFYHSPYLTKHDIIGSIILTKRWAVGKHAADRHTFRLKMARRGRFTYEDTQEQVDFWRCIRTKKKLSRLGKRGKK